MFDAWMKIATDTYFANVTAHDGSTCAQLYVGKLSLLTKVLGMNFLLPYWILFAVLVP
jgi:hypothetical protein